MYHAKDGLYFQRFDDKGSVEIIKKESALDDAEVLFDLVIDHDTWCSIVAAVSKSGDTAETFFLVENIHDGEL